MNSLFELNTWIEDVKSLEVTDNNLHIFENFMRFSPEKFADKLAIERTPVVKLLDFHKREIHNKVIIYKKVKELSKRKVESSSFFYQGKLVKTKVCYCVEYFKIKSVKFYPTIKYLYFYLDDEVILLPDENKKVIFSENEFHKHFIDKREEVINKILTNE